MVSFQCDNCGDVVKKPKLDQHRGRCHATFTCIDCSTTFQGTNYKSHTSCISEAEKYQKSLFRGKKSKQQQQQQQQQQQSNNNEAKKPVSLIDQLKNKKADASQEKAAESNGKRKAEDDKAKDNKKSKKDKNKWEDAELPADDKNKQIELALKEALKSNKGPLSAKDARKKVIKLLQAHPKTKKLEKSEIKDKFDEVLMLGLEGDKLTLKTA
ncbi:zf-LYAR-domain-containing protein [Lichtheimia hyalospora FSU 10163]|nr:zf-LYAR-domain-containing protein [Lichtheimia hyalospora FSU 10163]